MGEHCCQAQPRFEGLSASYRRALWAVIAINGAMFVIEMTAGFASGSQALKADALDFFADTVTYAISMAVIGHSLLWRTRAAIFKGLSLALMGLWVLGSTFYQVLVLGVPNAVTMGAIGLLALLANLLSVLLLYRYRDGDANVRSVWLCSRNDAIGNLAVMAAAVAVWMLASPWPDLLVAGVMASLFLSSALSILRQAVTELRNPPPTPCPATVTADQERVDTK